VKFLLLIYSNPASREIWSRLPAAQRKIGIDAYAALTDELAASGELVVTEALADPSQAQRVSVDDDGQTSVTDGPFPEVKELVAGFYLIDCEDRHRAAQIAARIPEATLGLVEVRPVMSLSGFLP
jgi:hypothetical protein